MAKCPWCKNPNSAEDSPNLCAMHAAESEGLSVEQYERRDREQYAEWLDCTR